MLACHGKGMVQLYKCSIFVITETQFAIPGNNQTARNVYCGCNNKAIFSERAVFTNQLCVALLPARSRHCSIAPAFRYKSRLISHSPLSLTHCQHNWQCNPYRTAALLFYICPTQIKRSLFTINLTNYSIYPHILRFYIVRPRG